MLDILIFSVVALAILVTIDLVWIWLVSRRIYRVELDEMLKDNKNYFVAAVVYILLAFGLVFFVTATAIADVNIVFAILGGLVFGFIVFATYALTNLSMLKKWSFMLALIDITWGSIAISVTSLLTYLIFV
ncbi:MAG: DUF2177 family protein [Clostridia bacterium]|nr:DUF2177 family protein [Clostridia bacterium]